jgi:tetratricopeptide (TPR) repeat protein
MTDVDCFQILASLLSTSNRNAVLGMQDGLDKAKIMAIQLLEDNQVLQTHDSRTYSMQLQYAQILHNHGSWNDAAVIQKSVLARRKQCEKCDDPEKLVEALRSYAQSLMKLGDVIESKRILEEALEICKASLKPENVHTLDCKEALAMLHKIEGHTEEAIKVSNEVLKTRRDSLGDTCPQTIGTLSDLAVYLALASHWEESMDMIDRARILATRNLNNQDVVNISVHLNASYLSGVVRLPVTERDERVVAVERGGRIIAIERGERGAWAPISNLADEDHDRNHESNGYSRWRVVVAAARYLRNQVSHTR